MTVLYHVIRYTALLMIDLEKNSLEPSSGDLLTLGHFAILEAQVHRADGSVPVGQAYW